MKTANRFKNKQNPNHGTHTTTLSDMVSISKLPLKHDIPEGHVAVNRNGFRLDPYEPPASPGATNQLIPRVNKQRVCNDFHLSGYCDNPDDREYDHDPLDEELKLALESLARSKPCPQRGACRIYTCTRGHICQIPDCRYLGRKAYCRLPYFSHTEDLAVARYVPATW
jgi:hypothetical protein